MPQPSPTSVDDGSLLATANKQAFWLVAFGSSSFRRLLSISFIACVEIVVILLWLEPHWGNDYTEANPSVFATIDIWEAHLLSSLVSFVAFFAIFAYAKKKQALIAMANEVFRGPFRWHFVAGHVLGLAGYVACALLIYDHIASGSALYLAAATKPWAGFCGMACLCLAAGPLQGWRILLRSTGWAWAFAAGAAIIGAGLGHSTRLLWQSGEAITFELVNITLILVEKFLSLFVSPVVINPELLSIGTERFTVKIADYCSGFQGIGLMLAFGTIWLCLFRRELAFPQSLLLLPSGVAVIFLLNSLRITTLILIGNAGAERIAISGFHSKAGWISFNVAALAFSAVCSHLPWFRKKTTETEERTIVRSANPTAAYLLPMVAILATGMLAGAASADFEWLYPVRFLAALAALWWSRRTYRTLDWSFGWLGLTVGVVVFLIWIGLGDSFTRHVTMPAALTSVSPPLRVAWISFRVLAAVITVPIAEELAFRGFVIRRFVSRDFELIPFRTFTVLGLAVSSVAFGLLHGSQWFVGIMAGLLYAFAMIRRNRIGEAVAAHATTNALLAAYVLIFQKWNLW